MSKQTRPRRSHKPQPPAKPLLTADQAGRVAALARLGYTIQPSHVATILEIPEPTLAAYLTTPEGSQLWKRARTEARAELVKTIQDSALSGDQQAQKLLITLLERDDTARTAEVRLPGPDVRELLGRTQAKISRRVRDGEWIDPGPDRQYALAAILALIPTLWDKLAAARKTIAHLEQLTEKGRIDEAEARRLAMLETARRRKRENDLAEGALRPADHVRSEIDRLCTSIRNHTQAMVEALALKLGATPETVVALEQARAECLRNCRAEMERRDAEVL
jgi:hypothetical protein